MKDFFAKIKKNLEKIIPMTFTSLILFAFIVYLITIVGKTVVANYNSNKGITEQEAKLVDSEREIHDLQNEINYYQTYSFKEKEARAKLGYKALGESIMSLPIDKEEEKVADSGIIEAKIKVPNYRLWWQYFSQ